MSGRMASEGDINAIVKEYLKYAGLEKSVNTFESECFEKGTSISSTEVTPKASEKLAAVQGRMLEMFDNGRRKRFFDLWMENFQQSVHEQLEFYLSVYFAIYARKHQIDDKEEGMLKFKQYLETNGQALSRTAEFTSYYALPYVAEPENHASFMNLFTEEWSQNLRSRLETFLKNALRALPKPRLLDIYQHSGGSAASVASMQQRLTDAHKKAERFKTEYHHLIGITASLVDTVENTVRGIPVSSEYLQRICNKLFSSHVCETEDFSRPGTAGRLLRESVVASQPSSSAVTNVLDVSKESSQGSSLNYAKIKLDLASPDIHYQTRGLLLQALRWKLTRSSPADRNTTLAAFVDNDILGCSVPGQYQRAILKVLTADNENVLLRQYMARLLNTFASVNDGRSYLAKNSELIAALIACLKMETEDVLTQDHTLGCLQRLSLKRQQQDEMIERDVMLWLVQLLQNCDMISDYMLEYAVALLMNLCLRTAGKKKCVAMSKQILKVLIDLLGQESDEIKLYVNGMLYSILTVPSIRSDARAMGLEDVLKCYIKGGQTTATNRQLEIIIKMLNTPDEEDTSMPSDTEEEDDDDPDGLLEADLDKNEMIESRDADHVGDEFLRVYYSTNSAANVQRKRRPTDSVLASEELLQRPVTPSRRNTSKDDSRDDTAPRLPSSKTRAVMAQPASPPTRDDIQRPPTRSGSRPNSANNVGGKSRDGRHSSTRPHRSSDGQPNVTDSISAFSARPKILRTPDGVPGQISRGSPPPPPKYSDSLPTPRPASGGHVTGQADRKPTQRTGSRGKPQ